jgi:uncharacterized RDD family membrane protein YckC
MEDKWYVCDNSSNIEGPFSKKEVHNMFVRGEINDNTHVWSKELGGWKLLTQIKCLIIGPQVLDEKLNNENLNRVLPPPIAAYDANETTDPKHYRDKESNNSEIETELNQVRPWVRYFAKLTDLFFFGNLFAIILAIVSFEGYLALYSSELVAGLIVLFIYNFYEALMLSVWGTTIGKWLFSTYVKDMRGNNLSYAEALARSFRVYVQGLGLGIPIISFITLVMSYNSLTNSEFGKSNWDFMGGHRVEHHKIKPLKILGLILLWALFVWLMV